MKMKTFFRCLVLMLCLVLAISVFAACNTGNGNETTGAGTEGSPTEGENTTVAPGTGEELVSEYLRMLEELKNG